MTSHCNFTAVYSTDAAHSWSPDTRGHNEDMPLERNMACLPPCPLIVVRTHWRSSRPLQKSTFFASKVITDFLLMGVSRFMVSQGIFHCPSCKVFDLASFACSGVWKTRGIERARLQVKSSSICRWTSADVNRCRNTRRIVAQSCGETAWRLAF